MGEVDYDALARSRRYEDAAAGMTEEFVEDTLHACGALGVLARPLGPARRLGWLICPSLGSEQGNLRRLEALASRSLAAAGFPTLRLRESAGTSDRPREVSLSLRLDQAEKGVELLKRATGAERVGLAGALFGATVAVLSAERLALDAVALWEPTTVGRRYLREALRLRTISEIVSSEDGVRVERGRTAREELEQDGYTVVRGRALTKEAFQEIEAVDISQGVRDFRGQALVLGVNPLGELRPSLRELCEHLESLGCEVTAKAVRDSLKVPFGEHYYWNLGAIRVDTRLQLDQRIAALTTDWSEVAEGSTAGVA